MTDYFHKKIGLSEPVLHHLRKQFAQAKDEETCCDCPGCNTCTGFVRGCKCDEDTGTLRQARETRRTQQIPVRNDGDGNAVPDSQE